MANGFIDYREMLAEMREKDDRNRPVPFDLVWVQKDGKWRSESGVVLCGQTDEMFRKLFIDIRYPNGSHHDTRVSILKIVRYNNKRMHL